MGTLGMRGSMDPRRIDAANPSEPYKGVARTRLMRSKSTGAEGKPKTIRDKIQPLPNLEEHTTRFRSVALDSVSRSDSSKTQSTDSSSRSRADSEPMRGLAEVGEPATLKLSVSQKKSEHLDDTQLASLLIDVIKNSEVEWGAFCLASGNVIPPETFIGLIAAELESAHARDDDDAKHNLIQFCRQWLNAHKNSDSARRAKTQLERFVALVRLYGFGSMQQMLEEALKPIRVDPHDDIPVPAKPEDFGKIIDEMVAKNDSTFFLDRVATDLRMQQIALFTQLSVKHIEVEYENPIPVGLQAYVQYNRSCTLFTAHTILKSRGNQECLLKFFLKLAITSLKKGDFELAGSIWEGLYGHVREQCGSLWASVAMQGKYLLFMSQLEPLFSPKGHFKALFESMNSYAASGKPYVPYVKAYLDTLYEIRELPPILVDAQGRRRLNNLNKLRLLKEQMDAYLKPQERFARSGWQEYRAATNLVSRYLKQMQPLSYTDLLLLGFPNLTEEVCHTLTPYQRWDLRMRLEAKHEADFDNTLLLERIKHVQRQMQNRSLIDALCERKEILWPLLILSNEGIIDTYTLFTTIGQHIDTAEKGFPLLTFCLEWLQANGHTKLAAAAKAAFPSIIERARLLQNGMINALAKRLGEFEVKGGDQMRAPAFEHTKEPVKDFKALLKAIDLDDDDLMEKIASDVTAHLSYLYSFLTPHDLIAKKWKSPPEVLQLIENHFNALTAYVKATLDAEKDMVKRRAMLHFYLGILEKCLKKNDFSNACALYLVIDSSDFQKSALEVGIERYRELFSPIGNFNVLRTTVESVKETALPYLGLVMKDLVPMEENPAIFTGEGDPMYNIDKLVQIKVIIDRFFAFKPYLEARRAELEAYVPHTNLVSRYLPRYVKKN